MSSIMAPSLRISCGPALPPPTRSKEVGMQMVHRPIIDRKIYKLKLNKCILQHKPTDICVGWKLDFKLLQSY